MSACQPATQEWSSHPCYSYRLTPAADSLKLSYGATVSVFVFIHYVIIVQTFLSVNLLNQKSPVLYTEDSCLFFIWIMRPSSCSCLYAALLNICYKLTGFRRVGCRCFLFAHSLHDGSKNQSSKRTGTKNLPAKCHWEVHHCCLEPYRNEIVACVLKK